MLILQRHMLQTTDRFSAYHLSLHTGDFLFGLCNTAQILPANLHARARYPGNTHPARDTASYRFLQGVDKKLWYICLLFLLIVIIYYISTGGIHMDDIKSPSAVTIGE